MNSKAIFLIFAIGLTAGAPCPPTAVAAPSDTVISIFYSTNDNKLQRNDPRQQKLDLKVLDMVPTPSGLKEVG